MAIAIVQTGGGEAATGTSVTLTFGSTPTNGSYLLCGLTTEGTGRTLTPPSGWTLLHESNNAAIKTHVYYKLAGGSESTTYNWPISGAADYAACNGVELSGVDTATPIDVSNTATPANSTDVAGPTLTPTVLSTQAVAFMSCVRNQAPTVTAGWTVTNYGNPWSGNSGATRNTLTSDTTTGISVTFSSGSTISDVIIWSALIKAPTGGANGTAIGARYIIGNWVR
jgi:hypothetical protein